MLVTLYFWSLLGLRLTYAATINVISASDPSILYSSGWSQEFSQSTQDSFMEADGFECALSVTLPSLCPLCPAVCPAHCSLQATLPL
jgi:hypothetical protein